MSKKKSNKNKNSNLESGGVNHTLNIIISFELAVKIYAKIDSRIRGLFNQAYDMVRAGEPQLKIASVLKQIMDIVKRRGSSRDLTDDKEEESPS